MEYTEDDYLMISGIQHFKFCRRQWALIHVEQQWAENVHTAVGKLMHQKVHDPYLTEKRKDTILVRALPVSSRIMGVSGECDLVEFHKCEDGIRLHGHRGMYSVYPVEYKKGKEKSTDADRLQLVAQVLCLEEMFSATIPEAALFYGETRRREVVEITEDSFLWIQGRQSGIDGILCRKKYLSLFYDAPGKISCEDNRKDKRKCAFARTAVCKQFGFSNQPGNCKKLYTWKGV